MKILIYLGLVAVVSAISDREKWNNFKVMNKDDKRFQKEERKYNKIYSTSDEEAQRFVIFQENLHVIENHNHKYSNGKTKHRMGITTFADLTQEEFFGKNKGQNFKNKFSYSVSNHHLKGFCWPDYYQPRVISSLPFTDEAPASIDYRDRNIIMPPRDMGNRTEDYAFSIAANLEAALALWNSTVEYLSPQYVIDCAGSLSDGYFKTFLNGLPRDDDYPLTDGKGECKELCTGVCFGYSVLAHESIIETWVGSVGPATIYFDGGDLALYESGIIDGSNCYYDPDNAWNPDISKWRKPFTAVVIGYGTENGTDYWILKNSFGTSWGEEGYFRLIKGQVLCGIEAYPVAPHYEDPQGECNSQLNF